MIAAGLLEAVAALLLDSLALITVLAGMHSAVLLQAGARAAQTREFRNRQVEFLIETAAMHSGSTDGADTVLAVGTDTVTLAASQDVAGLSAVRKGKPTTVALLADRGSRRLIHRLGRQTMTLQRDLPAASHLDVLDATGADTRTPAAAALLRLQLGEATELFAVAPGRR